MACPLSRRSWGGTRDKPKNVCVAGYLRRDVTSVGHLDDEAMPSPFSRFFLTQLELKL